MAKDITLAVVGNPNCGKTTLFNVLTGARQQVGNWPGVTVERKSGDYQFRNLQFEVVDLPGTYSLDVTEDSVSLDEQIARDYVATHAADVIVNIVDAANLERNLYLTSQLIEMQVPVLVALNMMDAAEQRGIRIDIKKLSRLIGCPVVPIVASKRKGIDDLKEAILSLAKSRSVPAVRIPYGPEFEDAVERIACILEENEIQPRRDVRWLAIKLLEADSLARQSIAAEIEQQISAIRANAEQALDDELDIAAADGRYTFINQVVRSSVSKTNEVRRSTSDRIDRIVLNRALGIPIFLLIMYTMFMLTINVGSAFIDFFDQLAGAFLVDGFAHVLGTFAVADWLSLFLAQGLGGGIQVVSTFIPIIGFLYLFLSMLEDSGYMARAAFVMDRFMRMIGLPGKAFVPLLVGFGCNVPAIMATRTMEHQRDRVLTIMMNPFMSCGARLPVYALFAAAFFPAGGQNLVFGLYLIGIGVAVMTGLIMTRTVFRGAAAPFVMELPAYHLPTLHGVLLRTWDRLKSFIFRAGKVIVPMVLVLNTLNAIGVDGSFGNENSEKSLLSAIGRTIAPVFTPMGLNENNWPATVGIFTGVLAKECVVGTLDALYSQLSPARTASEENATEPGFDLAERIEQAFATIPENFAKLGERLWDPLGLDIGEVGDLSQAAAEQEVVVDTYAAMRARFDGQAGAFAYLLFILLYFPCVAATAAIYRETGMGWAVFVVFWTTGLAFMAATIFYQIAVFDQHPLYSFSWIAGLFLAFGLVVLILRMIGRQRFDSDPDLRPRPIP